MNTVLLWFSQWVCCFYEFLKIYDIYLTILIRVASLTLGQSYDWPVANEVTLKDLGTVSMGQATTQPIRAGAPIIETI